MNKDQNQEDSIKSKPPISLDSLPEDTCLEIIKVIQGWVEEGRTHEDKMKARRTRDSTLRASSLLSSRTFDVFQRELVSNVNFSMKTIFSVKSMLEAHNSYGPLVKSIHLLSVVEQDWDLVARRMVTYFEDTSTPPDSASVSYVAIGLSVMTEAICKKLVRIQTMIVEDIRLLPHFEGTPSLVDSLKKVHLPLPEDRGLNASNVLWILTFCQSLNEASIGFKFRKEDYCLLEEHANHLVGISRVEKLSLWFNYTSDKTNKRTWWTAIPGKGNQKTQAMIYLLKIVKNLTALELGLTPLLPEAQVQPHFNCIFTLQSSFETMRHLRLFYLETDPAQFNGSAPYYSVFKHLKILTLDLLGLLTLLNYASLNETQLPSSTLETLVLPYYAFDPEEPIGEQLREEILLVMILKFIVSLKLVAVPSKLIGSFAEAPKVPPALEKVWRDRRSALKADKAIASGRVELREVQVGEIVGEQFMSGLTWLSPL